MPIMRTWLGFDRYENNHVSHDFFLVQLGLDFLFPQHASPFHTPQACIYILRDLCGSVGGQEMTVVAGQEAHLNLERALATQ